MSRKNYILTTLFVGVTIVAVVLGTLWLRGIAVSRINNERKQQLEELTKQVSDTFGDALAFGRACVGSAANLFEAGEYVTEEDVFRAAGSISDSFITGDGESSEDRFFFFVDEDGVCLDRDGERGVWGDFDQVVGMDEYCTFVADSVTYEGVYWAFVRKLDEPVVTQDGETTVEYVVLLKTVESMQDYYKAEAYKDVCQTYILKENGTRMYDSVTEEDTIPLFNIYKELREKQEESGEAFDEIASELETEGVAAGNYIKDGEEYVYSLATVRDEGVVLLFIISADEVAVNTLDMVSSMMMIFIAVGVVLITLILTSSFTVIRFYGNKRISEIREKNLLEVQESNKRLAAANASLKQATKAAESALDIAKSANRAKSSFLSNMSHDIRTPLNAIIGFLKLLESNADNPDKVRLYTDKINVSSQNLLNIINDILDMSRIESGKTTLNSEDFSIESLIDEVSTVITPLASEKDQTFTVDAGDVEGLAVRGDRLRLSQILENLLSNAVKYTGKGGTVQLIVQREGHQSAKMETLRFSVKDNGIGMSEDFQKRVFEPFERERTNLGNNVQGTGLGLAITKSLVDLMDGIILVESVQGKGSTFTIEVAFPLAGEDGDTMQAEAKPAAGAEALEETKEKSPDDDILVGCHFLVAEDNDINAEIIRELLSMEGATCEIASNGKEAVEFFEESNLGEYDAIFMDIQMPVMNGYEAARKIRQSAHPDAQYIPIAAMTANAFAEDVQKALQAGMNTHIPKPVDMKKVKEFMFTEKDWKERL